MKFDKSGYGALTWSLVSFGLETAKNTVAARKFVFSSSELVTRVLARYLGYESLYREYQAEEVFEDLIVAVYKALFEYTVALDDYLNRSGWSRSRLCGRYASEVASVDLCTFAGKYVAGIVSVDDTSISSKKTSVVNADNSLKDFVRLLLSLLPGT